MNGSMVSKEDVKVSVVIPAYNVRRYAARCLNALTSQTLREIEIICVDDGSTDGTGDVFAAEAGRDPRIRMVRQRNMGAGAARNAGLEVATGEYVFFFDPDDSCDRRMLEGMYFRAVQTNADIVIAGKCTADAESGRIIARYGFHRDIWALRQPFSGRDMADHVFTLAKSVPWDKLFRREFIERNGLRFQNTRRSNDVYFVDMALALAERIALVPRAYYVYSLDRAGSLQSAKDKTPLVFLDAYEALEEGLRRHGLWDWSKTCFARTLWRTSLFNLHAFRDPGNVEACYSRVRGIFTRLRGEVDLSHDTMLPQRSVSLFRIMLEEQSPDMFASALSHRGLDPGFDADADDLPHGRHAGVRRFLRRVVPVPFREFVKIVRVRIFRNFAARNRVRRQKFIMPGLLTLNFVDLSADKVRFQFSYYVKGSASPDVLPGAPVLLRIGATASRCGVVAGEESPVNGARANEKIFGRQFSCEARLDPGRTCALVWDFGENTPMFSWKEVKFGPYVPLTTRRRTSFFRGAGWIVRRGGERLLVMPDKISTRLKCGMHAFFEAAVHPSGAAAKAAVLRTAALALRAFRRRPLWLFADRPDRADDNARALFEYACRERSGVDAPCHVFAVSRASPDFRELSRIGKCVDINSFMYKALFLSADFMISAYRMPMQRRPFPKATAEFLKWFFAFRYRFACIRHGISLCDQSADVGREHLNLRILTTSARREYESILGGRYSYTAREVKLCGMARYDRLYDDRRGFVTLMPTWRSYLVKDAAAAGAACDALKSSEFCKCYGAVLGDEAFMDECRRLGYRVRVMIHPNMRIALPALGISPKVETIGPDASYRDLFATSDLLVTDYSSVAFDMAYLKKPVVYYQFDEDEFFSRQYRKGYFDWRRDGFGEVLTNADSLKATIISYLEKGCQMKPEYVKRVDDFFAFTDKNNCKRVYDEILKASREEFNDAGKAR